MSGNREDGRENKKERVRGEANTIKAASSDERVLGHQRRSGGAGGTPARSAKDAGHAGLTFRRLSYIAFFLSPVGGALTKNEIRRADIIRP